MLIAVYTASPETFLAMEKIPVGMPGKDKHIVIVDENRTEVAAGAYGQIVVASEYLASEIHGRNAHDKLIEDKENPGLKRYYTGDLGRINTQGLLEHYGRIDRQIKIHGLRIDPVVTENELEKYPGIERAVVVSIDLSEHQTRLAAGIKANRDISDMELIRHLAAAVPQSHIPQIFVSLESIPQGPHGKTDLIAASRMIQEAIKKKKSTVQQDAITSSYLKQLLIREWSGLLGETVADTSDSVFNLGADSMSVFDLTVRINAELSLNLEPAWILNNPSIDLQEAYLQSLLKTDNDEDLAYTPMQLKMMLGL